MGRKTLPYWLADDMVKIGVCMQTGNWTTTHSRIPNVVAGVGEVELKECENEEDYEEDQDSIEQDNEDGKRDDESDELEDTGKGGWSPRLESTTEEI